jgi:phosphoserine phosphatase
MNALLPLLLLATAVRAEVREIKSMTEIVPALTTSTLLVFDLDNTLIEPVGNIGSDQWWYYLVKAISRDEGIPEDKAEEKAAPVWTATLAKVKVKPVEALSPKLIAEQRARGLGIMALTARGPEDRAATERQLKDIGVDLAIAAPYTKELTTPNKGLFAKGVLFVGEGPNKGEELVKFLKTIGLKPRHIVFVDDKPKHAKSVDAALSAAKIPSVCFRYGAADAKVAAFNEVMGEAKSRAEAELLFHGREVK